MGVSYFFSAILGLITDRLLAGRFGAGRELDVFFAAFRIPDFVYNILIVGGITIVFLPLFAEYFTRDEKESWLMVNHVLNVFLLFLVAACLLLFLFTPWLVKIIFPGFDLSQINLAIPLVRLFFLSPIIFGVSNILSGILQYFHRFFVYGLTPILYNLGIIAGIIFLTPHYGIFGVGLGVILGALLHLSIQIAPVMFCGFRYKPVLNFQYPALKKIFTLMLPRIFGIAAQQINLVVITAIASTITAGAITIFNFSNSVQGLLVGLIGVSFAVAVFPTLARASAQKQKEEFLKHFLSIFRRIIIFIVPGSVLLFFLRNYIIDFIYRTGKFTTGSSHLTAACLAIFAFSIFAQALIPLLLRAFFSFQDTKTPTVITIMAMLLNVALSLFFVSWLRSPGNVSDFFSRYFSLATGQETAILGLPLAFSLSAIVQFFLLHFALKNKLKTTFQNG